MKHSILLTLSGILLSFSAMANDTIRIYSNGCDDYQTFIGSHGSQLTMTAQSDQWSHFVRWNDGNTDNPRTITTNGNADYTAEFAKYIFITKNAEHGTISGDSYAEYLDEVTLSVSSDYGYHFAQWSDGNTDNPRTIVLTQDTTFTAEFAKNIYSVSLVYDEDKGTVTGESGEFEYQTELTYKATPKYGYHFSYWDIGGKYISDTVKFLLPDSWYDPYAWIWETNGSGEWVKLQKKDGYYVCLSGENKNILFVPYGPYWDYGQSEDVSIAAGGIYKIEEDQYVYNRYQVYCNVVTEISGGGSIIKNDSITLTVNDNIVIHAVFRPNQYILATNSDSMTNGIVVGTGEFDYLSEDTISAVPDFGYHFTQWSDGNTDNPRVIVLTQDTTFTAEFALNLTDKCGKDSALTWAYDLETKTLTFSGDGELTENYTFGVVARLAENIVLSEGLTAIGESAFYNSKHVKEIVVPATTTVIDNYAFADCDSLQSLTIKNGEAELGYGVANNCKSLRFIEAPAEIMQGHYSTAHQAVTFNGGEMISDYFFGLSPMTLQSLDLGKTTVTTFPNNILSTFRYLNTLVLPTNMTEIEYALAADCYYLDSITIPAGVTEIDDRAFYNCHSLAKVEFVGINLQRIGAWAFYNCHELSQINLPEGVTEIGKAAFYGCAYANQAHIPASVQAIGDNAFALCSKLSKMVVDAVVPPTVEDKTFYEVSTTAPVYVPETSVENYKSHPVWGKLNIVGNPNAPQSVDQVPSDQVQSTKFLRNGQILILRGEKTYTVTGQETK